MAHAFERKVQNSVTLIDRLLKANKNSVTLAQNQNQQNIPIQQNATKNDTEVISSKINKTESIDIFIKNQNQINAHKKIDYPIVEDKEKPQKQARPSPGGLSVFDPNYKDEIKKQDKIPKGRLLTLKIVSKQNKSLGQLQLDQNYLKSKGNNPPSWKQAKVQINKQFKHECEQAWTKIKQYKQTLNLALNSTNLSILSNLARAPHQPIPGNIIHRLTDGFYFYEFRQERDEAIRELIKQYTETGINSGLCDQVKRICQKTWQGTKVDGALAFYYCLNGGRDDDCSMFLMQDMVNLIRIYQELMKQGRLSSRKLISSLSQKTILETLPKYYRKYMNSPLGIDLGRQILSLLNIMVIKHKRQINMEQLIAVFVPLIKQLQNMLWGHRELKAYVDSFMIELFVNWQCELVGVQMGGNVEQFVIGYYRRYQGKDTIKLHTFMLNLAEFTLYGGSMQPILVAKCQQFIAQNKKNLEHNSQILAHIAMQAILLLSQCKKANINQPQLLQVLYQCCPVAIFPYLHNTTHHIQMILPLICKYYKNLSNKSNQLTLAQLNSKLPASYALPKSDNYLIIKYMVDLLVKFTGKQAVGSCYQNLDDIQQTLLKFNASSIVRQTSDHVPMEIVKLLSKYVVGFASQSDGTDQDSTYQVVGFLFSAMQALITYFYSETKGTDYCSLAGVICNLEMLSCIIMSSGLLTINREKDSVQRKRKQSENNTKIWETYTKITQLFIRIREQFPSSSSDMKLMYGSCMKIYEEYWNGLKESNRWLKMKIYLQSALTVMQMQGNPKQRYEMVLLLDRRYKTYSISHALQEIMLSRDMTDTLCLADWQVIVRKQLILLAHLLVDDEGQVEGQQISAWQDSIKKIVRQNAQQLMAICLSRLHEDKANPDQTIKYCRMTSYILEHQNYQKTSSHRNHSNNTSLFALITKPPCIPFRKQPPTLPQFISSLYLPASSSKVHILFSLIAANFDDQLFSTVVELGYLPSILNATLALMSKLTESNNEHVWLITCLDMFSSLYFRRYVQVDTGNGAILAHALLHILTTRNYPANPLKMSQYMQIVLPLISSIGANKSYQALLRAFISHFSTQYQNLYNHQYHATQSNKQVLIRHFVIVIQILMVSLSNDSITASMFEGITEGETQSVLGEMAHLLTMLYDGVHQIGCMGDKSLQKRIPTLVVISLKISQYINICQIISSKSISKTASHLATAIKKSHQTIICSVGQTISTNMQQMLSSSIELLQSRCQTNSYNHYNQVLINLSMLTKTSFTNFLVGLGANIIGTLHKMRRSSTKPGIDNYRCYYLFYYFLHRVLQDDTGKYINYLYDTNPQDYLTTQVTLQQPIRDTFINLINQLSQCTGPITIEIWHISLISTILKLQPKIIHTGTTFSKLVRFCCKLMEIVQNMGQEVNYLQGWLCFAQVVDFLCFIYETHSYCGQVQEDVNFLSKAICHKVQLWILKWDDMHATDEQKFICFPVWPLLSPNNLSDKASKPIEILNKTNLRNYQLSAIKIGPQDKSSSENNRPGLIQNRRKVWYYLKHIMVLHSLCKVLDLYRLDIQAPLALGSAFRSRLIEFAKKMLIQFSKYYDQYFGQENSANLQILKKGILHYAKDAQLTNTSLYLNKILFCHTYEADCNCPLRKMSKNELNTSLGSSSPKQLNAIAWFNGIEEILACMGEKVTYKFMTGKTNGMLGSRKMNASIRASTSRRAMF